MPIDRAEVRSLADFYRRYLLDDIVAFWTARTNDPEHPGHLVQFDRAGQSTGTDKYIWCQGRPTWMFAALYNHLEPRRDWLELARTGRDLLVHHAHAGEGRFHYRLHRDGSVCESARSLLTDSFALIGLCEYAVASGCDDDLPLIRTTFDALERHYHEPGFNEYHHFNFDPALRYHGPAMVGVGMAPVLRPVLGAARVQSYVDLCFERALWEFAKDDHAALFEVLDGDGEVMDTPAGQTINPGHALESMWFCMEEAMARDDERAIERAAQVMEWTCATGRDCEHGGLFAFTDPKGDRPPRADGPNFAGETWDTKIWWVHSEALYALALAALLKDDDNMWSRFLEQHDYWQRAFADPTYGEWYTYLDRDGTPRVPDKGTWVKSAFHTPRALMKLVLLLEQHGAAST